MHCNWKPAKTLGNVVAGAEGALTELSTLLG